MLHFLDYLKRSRDEPSRDLCLKESVAAPTTNSITQTAARASDIRIPRTYNGAVADPQWAHEWKRAIEEDIIALLLNQTFEFIKKPNGVPLVSY